MPVPGPYSCHYPACAHDVSACANDVLVEVVVRALRISLAWRPASFRAIAAAITRSLPVDLACLDCLHACLGASTFSLR